MQVLICLVPRYCHDCTKLVTVGYTITCTEGNSSTQVNDETFIECCGINVVGPEVSITLSGPADTKEILKISEVLVKKLIQNSVHVYNTIGQGQLDALHDVLELFMNEKNDHLGTI